MNDNKTIIFLNYIANTLTRESIDLIFATNNIKYDRCNLYNDFIQSLFLIIFDTYMGDKFTNDENKVSHFKWCWSKNLDNFKKENIIFNKTDDLFDYFSTYIFDAYYLDTNAKTIQGNNNILKLWSLLFNYDTLKTRSDVDILIDVYELFDKSLVKR